MHDPVICADGHSYERTYIQQWLSTNITSPMTGLAHDNRRLIPNYNLRNAIREWATREKLDKNEHKKTDEMWDDTEDKTIAENEQRDTEKVATEYSGKNITEENASRAKAAQILVEILQAKHILEVTSASAASRLATSALIASLLAASASIASASAARASAASASAENAPAAGSSAASALAASALAASAPAASALAASVSAASASAASACRSICQLSVGHQCIGCKYIGGQ